MCVWALFGREVNATHRHRHHVVDHSFHPAATGRAVPVTVSAVPSRDAATVHRVILQAVFHRAVVVTVVVHSGSAARPAMVHQHVLAVVVMLRVVHIRFLKDEKFLGGFFLVGSLRCELIGKSWYGFNGGCSREDVFRCLISSVHVI